MENSLTVIEDKKEFETKIIESIMLGERLEFEFVNNLTDDYLKRYKAWDAYNLNLLKNSFKGKYDKNYSNNIINCSMDSSNFAVELSQKLLTLKQIVEELKNITINDKLFEMFVIGGVGAAAGLAIYNLGISEGKTQVIDSLSKSIRKYQVFISSTYDDLKSERAEVSETLLESNCIPVSMEQFPASSLKQMDFIKKVMDNCDYVVLIIAGRYGSTCKDEEGNEKSYTEREYEYALKKNIPVLIYVRDTDYISSAEQYVENTEGGKKCLEKFINEVSPKCIYKKWTTSEDLKYEVLRGITAAIENIPRSGWIKRDCI